MCGIAAIFMYRDESPVDRAELMRVRERMLLRGPDAAGTWISPKQHVGLAHRRLSIIDLSETGAQPMLSADGKLAVVFNGEIYNYRELRQTLEQKGRRFRSRSDTEVLLHLYEEKGQAMVGDLRGMYAFAIWDEEKQGLFVARDPFGIKPLYYADNGQAFRLASQVKALLAGGQIDTAPEPAGHVGFFLWGCVPDPYTLYRGIRSLPAGHSLWVDRHGARIKSFYRIADILAGAEKATHTGSSSVLPAALGDLLQDTLRHHLIADVPVGIFLSAGLDSTTVAALASQEGGELRTVTLGFAEFKGTDNDETPLAEQVARLCGAAHQTVWVTRADFEDHTTRLLEAMDQPSTDGVNTYFVSLAARRAGLKVALSGLGGDEIFGGYPSFHDIPKIVQALAPANHWPRLGRAARIVSGPVLKHFTSPKYAGLLEYGGTFGGAYLLRRGLFMPWELPRILDGEMVRAGWRELQTLVRLEETILGISTPRLRISALETCWYMRNQLLRDSDWASMAHSLELRVPLVDVELLRGLAPLLAGANPPGKLDMAHSPARKLPAEVLRRAKTGFFIPVQEWLQWTLPGAPKQRGLRGWMRHVYANLWKN